MSAKLERIYWLEFLRHRLLAPIAYDRRHNGYRLTDDSFELPSYWFNPPALLFLAATCNQLRHLEGGSFGGLAGKVEPYRLHHYLGNWYLVGGMFRHPEQHGGNTPARSIR